MHESEVQDQIEDQSDDRGVQWNASTPQRLHQHPIVRHTQKKQKQIDPEKLRRGQKVRSKGEDIEFLREEEAKEEQGQYH